VPCGCIDSVRRARRAAERCSLAPPRARPKSDSLGPR
jgi:hypothetical protein